MEESAAASEKTGLSWIEETLIEAWACPSAPPAPHSSDTEEPWFACYKSDAAAAAAAATADWQKVCITDQDDPRHGCYYYLHVSSQSVQWERPPGYESPVADLDLNTDEARRQARFLTGVVHCG